MGSEMCIRDSFTTLPNIRILSRKIHYINCLAVACPVSLPCLIVALSHKADLPTTILLVVLVYMRCINYIRYKTFASYSAVIHGFTIFIQGTQVRTLLSMVAFYNHLVITHKNIIMYKQCAYIDTLYELYVKNIRFINPRLRLESLIRNKLDKIYRA